MNNFWLLFFDELRHLRRVKFVLAAAIVTPILTGLFVFLHLDYNNNTNLSFVAHTMCLLMSLTIGAVLTSTLINDITNRTILPFLVRPVTRFTILFSRLVAIVAVGIGIMLFSILMTKYSIEYMFSIALITDIPVQQVLLLNFTQILIASSLGLILGVSTDSATLGSAAFILLGMMLINFVFSGGMLLPYWLNIKPMHIAILLFVFSLLIACTALYVANIILKKKIIA